ncbi:MAG TPA: helix-turn-helix domain-containing protein [Candidatus Solibacter sp.]|nr:helix-turn-helix domain-containing protein [Candidatus Solibacter sp.]
MTDTDLAASFAIFVAKQRGSAEVTPDHILLGCLRAISRFGIATIGPWSLDLESLGVDWVTQPEGPKTKTVYSEGAVAIFDRATAIARTTSDLLSVFHLLAAFATEETGLMGELKRAHGITSASWRAAIAQLAAPAANGAKSAADKDKVPRDFLTPEEAAEALSVHVQTMRIYIRSGRLPAFRIAGERAIRIRRVDLEKLLEPLTPESQT